MPQTNGGDDRLQNLLGVSPSVVDAAIAGNRHAIEEVRQSATTTLYAAPVGTPAPAYRNRVGNPLRTGRAQWFNVGATWDALASVTERAAFTAEALTDALEPPTPEPNLPEREPRSYPLLPAEQVLSTSNLIHDEDDFDIDEEDDGPDPAHMYRYGAEPPRMLARMRREPPTEEELENLRAFADQWSSLSMWGLQQGFLTINPRDVHEGAFIPQHGRLSEFYEYEPPVNPAPPRVNGSSYNDSSFAEAIDPFVVAR